MTTNQSAGKDRNSFSSALFDSLVAAISEACGSPWLVAAVPSPGSTAEESELVRLNLTLEGNLRGELLFELPRAEAAMLAAKCLKQPIGDYGDPEARALQEVIQTGANAFSSAVVEDYGIFTITASSVEEPAPDRSNVAEMSAADDAGNRISVLMYLDPALAEALSPPAEPADETGEPATPVEDAQATDEHAADAQTTEDQTTGAPTKEGAAIAEQLNLKLVMDVELNVTLRFGQRQLALREVMELTSGSVVELDRQVDEPVELLLEGKVIARGEAVVIDGNYGLRVTEVPQPVSSAVLR
jgi:flagellar motor switch protein FliN/FliY